MVAAVERAAVTDAAGCLHGFPATLTSFVGRGRVVDEVAGHLGQYRLVTVTGPGGCGKTRLASEVARTVADRFADGVWLVELALFYLNSIQLPDSNLVWTFREPREQVCDPLLY
jgi:hypothetical protein